MDELASPSLLAGYLGSRRPMTPARTKHPGMAITSRGPGHYYQAGPACGERAHLGTELLFMPESVT